MIHTNLWTPDTCPGCQLEWSWDDAVEPIVMEFLRSVKLCQPHQLIGLVGGRGQWDWVLDENRRKNIVLVIAQAEAAGVTPDDYTWSYDAARVLLTISFTGLNVNQKTRIQAACDLQFGPGKVLVI